ncbi:hypothetical protein B0H11DRAFT_2254121 [Mycena galericulata]|nr:hypothetical protein B0H11DRAFT_2254121 [Mycena galericulata]
MHSPDSSDSDAYPDPHPDATAPSSRGRRAPTTFSPPMTRTRAREPTNQPQPAPSPQTAGTPMEVPKRRRKAPNSAQTLDDADVALVESLLGAAADTVVPQSRWPPEDPPAVTLGRWPPPNPYPTARDFGFAFGASTSSQTGLSNPVAVPALAPSVVITEPTPPVPAPARGRASLAKRGRTKSLSPTKRTSNAPAPALEFRRPAFPPLRPTSSTTGGISLGTATSTGGHGLPSPPPAPVQPGVNVSTSGNLTTAPAPHLTPQAPQATAPLRPQSVLSTVQPPQVAPRPPPGLTAVAPPATTAGLPGATQQSWTLTNDDLIRFYLSAQAAGAQAPAPLPLPASGKSHVVCLRLEYVTYKFPSCPTYVHIKCASVPVLLSIARPRHSASLRLTAGRSHGRGFMAWDRHLPWRWHGVAHTINFPLFFHQFYLYHKPGWYAFSYGCWYTMDIK